MGVWNETILGNDTSCEIYEAFFEQYNKGKKPEDIAPLILTNKKSMFDLEPTNALFGLALACWECKTLTLDLYNQVKDLIESGKDIEISNELEADEHFVKRRKLALEKFLQKISIEKEKPKPVVKKRVFKEYPSNYNSGLCFAYKNKQGKYHGLYIESAVHYKSKGTVKIIFFDAQFDKLPTLQDFLDCPITGARDYRKHSNAYSLATIVMGYDDIYERDEFEYFMKNGLNVIGSLPSIKHLKLVDSHYSFSMNYLKPKEVLTEIEAYSNRMRTSLIEYDNYIPISLNTIFNYYADTK